MGFLKDLLILCGIVKETKQETEAPASINTESACERFYGDKNETSPQVAQFDELDNIEFLSTKNIDAEKETKESFKSSDPQYGIDAVAELSKILYEEVAKIPPPISIPELTQKSIEEESKNVEKVLTSDFISDYSDKAFVLYDPRKSVKENFQIKPNSRPRKELRAPKPCISLPTYIHKKEYDYDKPMVIKATNIKNSQDTQIFVSARQICEHFGMKQKKFYICLNSIDKLLDGKYELEIISFMENYKTPNPSNFKYVIPKEIEKDSFVTTPEDYFFSIPSNNFTKKKRKFVSIEQKAPALVAEWDITRNGVAASEVPCSIKKEAYWLCPKCGHSYTRRVDNRVRRPEIGCTKCLNKTSV